METINKELQSKLANLQLLSESVNGSKSTYRIDYLKSFKQTSDTAKRNFIRKQVFLKLCDKICKAENRKDKTEILKLVNEFNSLCKNALLDIANKPKFTSDKNKNQNEILQTGYLIVDFYNNQNKK
jgi:hypothetical protein